MCEICSKSTIIIPEWRKWRLLVSLLLILNRFHTLCWCFHYWLWTSKYPISGYLLTGFYKWVKVCWGSFIKYIRKIFRKTNIIFHFFRPNIKKFWFQFLQFLINIMKVLLLHNIFRSSHSKVAWGSLGSKIFWKTNTSYPLIRANNYWPN